MEISAEVARLRGGAASGKWSLEEDAALLRVLEGVHSTTLELASGVEKRRRANERALGSAAAALLNADVALRALRDARFVESGVRDDPQDEGDDRPKDEREERASEDSFTKHILEAMAAIPDLCDEIGVSDDEDSDSDEAEPRPLVLRPKDPYAERRLPPIIGSRGWSDARRNSASPDSSVAEDDDTAEEPEATPPPPRYAPVPPIRSTLAAPDPTPRSITTDIPKYYQPAPALFPDEPPPLDARSDDGESSDERGGGLFGDDSSDISEDVKPGLKAPQVKTGEVDKKAIVEEGKKEYSTKTNDDFKNQSASKINRESTRKTPSKIDSLFQDSDTDDNIFNKEPKEPTVKTVNEFKKESALKINKEMAQRFAQKKDALFQDSDSDDTNSLFDKKSTVNASDDRKKEPAVKSAEPKKESSIKTFDSKKEPAIKIAKEIPPKITQKRDDLFQDSDSDDGLFGLGKKIERPKVQTELPAEKMKSKVSGLFDDTSDSDGDLFGFSKKKTLNQTKKDLFSSDAVSAKKKPSRLFDDSDSGSDADKNVANSALTKTDQSSKVSKSVAPKIESQLSKINAPVPPTEIPKASIIRETKIPPYEEKPVKNLLEKKLDVTKSIPDEKKNEERIPKLKPEVEKRLPDNKNKGKPRPEVKSEVEKGLESLSENTNKEKPKPEVKPEVEKGLESLSDNTNNEKPKLEVKPEVEKRLESLFDNENREGPKLEVKSEVKKRPESLSDNNNKEKPKFEGKPEIEKRVESPIRPSVTDSATKPIFESRTESQSAKLTSNLFDEVPPPLNTAGGIFEDELFGDSNIFASSSRSDALFGDDRVDIFSDIPPEYKADEDSNVSDSLDSHADVVDNYADYPYYKKINIITKSENKPEMLDTKNNVLSKNMNKGDSGLFSDSDEDLFGTKQSTKKLSNKKSIFSDSSDDDKLFSIENQKPVDPKSFSSSLGSNDKLLKSSIVDREKEIIKKVVSPEDSSTKPNNLASDVPPEAKFPPEPSEKNKNEHRPTSHEIDGALLSTPKKTMKLNINVKALLPSSHNTVKKINESIKEDSTPSFQSIENISNVVDIEPSSFEDPKSSNTTLSNDLLKNRAKIPIKRRPSSRTARHEAARNSMIAIQDPELVETDEKDCTVSLPSSPVQLPRAEIEKPKEINVVESHKSSLKVETTQKIILESSKVQMVEGSQSKSEIKTFPEKNIVKKSTNDIFKEDSNDDLFSSNKSKVTKPTKKSNIFDDSDSDSDLFSQIPKPKATSTKKPQTIQSLDKSKSIFDDDDSDDLFSTKSVKPLKSNENVTKKLGRTSTSLFDDDDNDDDIFSSSKLAKPQTSTSNVKNTNKPNQKTEKSDVFKDPLSSFLDS